MRSVYCAVVIVLLVACGSEEQSVGDIPKDTLDQVSKDVEKATEEAKEKIDDALENLE